MGEMKTRPRRKVRASGAEAEDDDPMDSPGNSSSKENDSPRRLSLDVQQERFLVLLADFDNNGELEKVLQCSDVC